MLLRSIIVPTKVGERSFERAAAREFSNAALYVFRDRKNLPGTHCCSEEASAKRGGFGPMLFSVRASANRHAGSLLISSTRAGETGLTKVKNFSRGVFRASRSNDFPDRLFTSRRTAHGFPAFEPKKYFRSR